MSKEVIGVDIDDVLADTAEGFTAFSNEYFGTTLSVADYTEHWAEMWRVDNREVERRAAVYNHSGAATRYRHREEARPVLDRLAEQYDLLALTSRNGGMKEQTFAWIETHFSGLFKDIQFAGIFDGPLHDGMLSMTKADLFASNNVNYVIDDQLKHCRAAAQLGIRAVLFGNYHWNTASELPPLITRCDDWQAVGEYFDARS